MPTNRAAWLPAVGKQLEVRESALGKPSATQILIKVHAWAINPADHILQDMAWFDFLTFPTVLGADVAGEVISAGESVTAFAPGDRVAGVPNGLTTNTHAQQGFNEYVVMEPGLCFPLPASLSYEDAVVFPLTVATAAAALFESDALALAVPVLGAKPQGKSVVVWGGASAVGSNAIQLAAAAGYDVVATASAANFGYVKSLGASEVFDYKEADVVGQIVRALEGKGVAGVFQAAGPTAQPACFEIAQKTGRPRVATALPIGDKPEDIEAKFVFASTIMGNHVGPAVFGDFLPKALAQGRYIVAPRPEVVGRGLESIQKGFDVLRKGVSAKKIVVVP